MLFLFKFGTGSAGVIGIFTAHGTPFFMPINFVPILSHLAKILGPTFTALAESFDVTFEFFFHSYQVGVRSMRAS